MPKVSESIRNRIYTMVQRDLEPSRVVVHSKIAGAIFAGGLFSLFMCAQLGYGLSDFSHGTHKVLMDFGGFYGCTAICGLLFSIVPVVVLKLCTSDVQYSLLLRRERWAFVGWITVFGAFLTLRNSRPDSILVLALWGGPALLSFYALSLSLKWIVSASKYCESEL
ncbi:MAG: hypothetical protein AB7T49_20145 [Oligoflexales bacterium]